jgi:hypothetical protein
MKNEMYWTCDFHGETYAYKILVEKRNRCDHLGGMCKWEKYAILLLAWTGPRSSRRFRLPEFLDTHYMKIVRLSALHTGKNIREVAYKNLKWSKLIQDNV